MSFKIKIVKKNSNFKINEYNDLSYRYYLNGLGTLFFLKYLLLIKLIKT